MNVVTWGRDTIEDTVNALDDILIANGLSYALSNQSLVPFDTDSITTDIAITICKMKLMGEYHGILVRHYEELLSGAEVYLLTWDGEASDGGRMDRLDDFLLKEIANGTYTERLVD